MTIEKIIKEATKKLNNANVATARLDCLILLEDAIGKDRSWLLAHPEFECRGQSLTLFNAAIARRATNEPLAYIRGKSEFYGREFIVNSHTLEPRPETETMIEQLLKLVESGKWIVDSKKQNNSVLRTKDLGLVLIDVGTGSGCIGITAKLELPTTKVVGIDIDEKCIKTAKENTTKLRADVSFLHGNLLLPILENENLKMKIEQNNTILLCNLPYVPLKYELNSAAKYEPEHAIFGGEDGLDLYRELFDQIMRTNLKPAYIFTESLPSQHAELAKISLQSGYRLLNTEDFIQVFANYVA